MMHIEWPVNVTFKCIPCYSAKARKNAAKRAEAARPGAARARAAAAASANGAPAPHIKGFPSEAAHNF
ncbi:hypothetical protein EVAR_14984_1 [Eumeta japonica]|uniref:Uncharacterized protein n=1 Tax=Eumeta variegata TaxID=151549 RepID=A0A4C1X739_EUMVA|nr:hypothetical protein EVAR_14984_1 [Eumeta japonica]